MAAAGAAVFTLPSHANAGIVYTPNVNETRTWANSSATNSSRAAANGFTFVGFSNQTANPGLGGVKAIATVNQAILLNNSGGVKKLKKGSSIGTAAFAGHSGANGQFFLKELNAADAVVKGTWSGDISKQYYVGVKNYDPTSHATHFGYITLKFGNDGNTAPADGQGIDAAHPDSFTIVDYAFNNGPVGGGQTSDLQAGVFSPVPEASNVVTALMLLACAGGSLTSWRRSKKTPVAALA